MKWECELGTESGDENIALCRFKATDANRLRQEYNRLVEGLAQRGNLPGNLLSISSMGFPICCMKMQNRSGILLL
jgi:hypothetical protein